MIKPIKYLISSAWVTLLCITPVGAQLVLTIDPANETYELSGSDSGNVEYNSSENVAEVFWTVFDLGTDGGIVLNQQDPALSVTGWTPTDNGVVTLEFSGQGQFAVFLSQDTTTDIGVLPITVTALGGTVDYSGHSNEFKTAFESLIGGTIPLANGSSFGDIVVQGPNVIVLGDANDDGKFNNGDIGAFLMALTNLPGYMAMYPDVDPDSVLDMNDDGVFNNGDIGDFVAALTGT